VGRYSELVHRLTWNGQARTAEAEQLARRALELRASLPPGMAAAAASAEGGRRAPLLLTPLDWWVASYRADQWDLARAWGAFLRGV
jgi:hypothetical protein